MEISGNLGGFAGGQEMCSSNSLENRFAVLCGAWAGGGGNGLCFIILDRKYSYYP